MTDKKVSVETWAKLPQTLNPKPNCLSEDAVGNVNRLVDVAYLQDELLSVWLGATYPWVEPIFKLPGL